MAVLYTFKCDDCDSVFEQKLSYADYDEWRNSRKELVSCAKCGRWSNVRRILTLVDMPTKTVLGAKKGEFNSKGPKRDIY